MNKVLTLTLVLVALSSANIPYKIVKGKIVWKPVPNDIQK